MLEERTPFHPRLRADLSIVNSSLWKIIERRISVSLVSPRRRYRDRAVFGTRACVFSGISASILPREGLFIAMPIEADVCELGRKFRGNLSCVILSARLLTCHVM